jgi:F-type H+-transporting ATPase subunit b
MSIFSVVSTSILHIAAEATDVAAGLEELHESGFGIGTDFIGSNFLNIAIVLGVLIYLGKDVVGETLNKRRAAILQELEQAEQRQQASLEQLADQQQKLAQAQQEAERIKQQAEANAQTLKAELLAQVDVEIQRMQAAAEKDVSSEQDRVIQQLRRQIVQAALAKVESDLPARVDDHLQRQFIDRSIQLLGGRS